MKRDWLVAAMGLALAEPTLAEEIKTPAAAFDAGQGFANSAKGKDAAAGALNTATGAANVPKYNTDPPETGIYGDGKSLIGIAGSSKQSKCVDHKAANAYDQQECNAVNYLTKLPDKRPKFVIGKKTDPLIVNSKETITHPGTAGGSGKSACHIEKTLIPGTYSFETCVEVQTFEHLTCNKVLVVACDPETDGCDTGGIVPGSTQGDMRVSFAAAGGGDYALEFGTFADNYWNDCGAIQQRSMSFEIADARQITKFLLALVAWDDYIYLSLNDVPVYTGPDGGNTLYVFKSSGKFSSRRVCSNSDQPGLIGATAGPFPGNCTASSSPERLTSWRAEPNIDLRPFLKTGINQIKMAVLACGGGEGAMRVLTRMKCPRVCHETWDDSQCAPLASRAR
ncbi:MAG: hypothetical protein OEM00_12760 [Burkholderiaceae bacterium]|nr:hypothetical protein [Burkholderiaceae bacterium]